jgi:hypothetical protein
MQNTSYLSRCLSSSELSDRKYFSDAEANNANLTKPSLKTAPGRLAKQLLRLEHLRPKLRANECFIDIFIFTVVHKISEWKILKLMICVHFCGGYFQIFRRNL